VTEDLSKGLLGVCYVDASTGAVCVGQCEEDEAKNRLRTLLAQLRPAEIILDLLNCSREAHTLLRRAVPDGCFQALPEARFGDASSTRAKLDAGGYFEEWPRAVREAAAMETPVGFGALGGCVGYLQRLLLARQLLTLGIVTAWTPSDSSDALVAGRTLVLDGKALDNLEVFQNSTDRGPRGTLFHVLDQCATPFGKRKLRRWLCAPLQRVDELAERQDAVAALIGVPDVRTRLLPTLRKLPDLERLLAKVHAFSIAQASNSSVHYEDVGRSRLVEFIKTLEGLQSLQTAMGKLQELLPEVAKAAPRLAEALTVGGGGGFPELDATLGVFRHAFGWAAAKAEGRVVPSAGADEPYEAAKEELAEVQRTIEAVLAHWQGELGDTSIELYTPGGSTTTEPYQLAVSEATLRKYGGPPADFEQMSSKKGTIRFWTPELKKAVAAHLAAKEESEKALKAVASRLFGRFSKHFALWHAAVSCAAELDCLLSLAKVSLGEGMCRPRFVESAEPFIDIRQGVNICVQSTLGGGADCIPNDMIIGGEAAASPLFLLVTGPNMGGKSTLLRQACLTVMLAQVGCWVPAEACALSPVDRIFTRVGANDAIMAGLSTFRVELEETALILNHATRRSLVILDELGRGTATFDGMAIAHATMQQLVGATRCRALFATHYHALTREFERPNPQA
jgi:DNA mismatch repair protein MSH6